MILVSKSNHYLATSKKQDVVYLTVNPLLTPITFKDPLLFKVSVSFVHGMARTPLTIMKILLENTLVGSLQVETDLLQNPFPPKP